ncbi:musculin [Polyodon spathula]|uniref:musculin n=1 Tax=Polyodon spathula TaxID=7913 RepID=UPI001B7E1A19|nr:musculin [Polyodon spathula]
MSTGSVSDTDDIQEMVIQGLDFQYHGSKEDAMDNDLYNSAAEDECCTEFSGSSNCSTKKKRSKSGASKSLPRTHKECKQSQRNAANSRERARMRVLSKAFSRLKTSLPWVPPDTKLSKLDTLRLASNYIAHLRQLLQEDRYEKCFVHPANLTWPFVVSGRPDSENKDVSATSRFCGATA